MKKTLMLVVTLLLLFVPQAFAVTALWDHSPTQSVVKYKIAWGTVQGTYPNSQEMNKSACVAGVHPTAGPYDCKLVLNGTFTINTTYYFVGYAINYSPEGIEQSSPPTPSVTFIMRPDGTTGPVPSPMQELGIYKE